MKLIVTKFGGTSVGTIDRIKSVAKRIKKEVNNGYNVIVVVSAMAGETNRLIKLVESLTSNYRTSEYDTCLLYTSPSPRDQSGSRMPSSA